MTVTYQDVLRANGAVLSYALTESAGTDFAPWIGGTHMTGGGGLTYQQAGPFAAAFGLGLAIGAHARFPYVAQVLPPFTTEMWMKLGTRPPAANQYIFQTGNGNLNGAGLYVAVNNHIHFYAGGVSDVDSGYAIPDTNWHLYQLVATDGTHSVLYVDGIGVQNGPVVTPNAPVPNGQGLLCDDNAYNVQDASLMSYPTLYQHALDPIHAYASFLAATDPTTALNYVLSAQGGGLQLDLLNQILAAVTKIY